ncbi:MAG: DNA polymerase I [Candidatus Shikimatogenerans bostrichidophilus]|nr:MAG: DNA polymerase I [Candidatus Shikimatogenerans bostrichidophilus]
MNLIEDKRLFLIDSFIYIYKYYYYYKKYYKENSIIYGFTNFIINILIKKRPTYIYVILDDKIKNNYKKKIFKKYKSNRKKIPFNLKKNLLVIKKILNILSIKFIKYKNIEADDIIGSIVKNSEKKGFVNYIYTEDKDYYQLVSSRTFIIKNNLLIDEIFILNKFNINNTKQYIDLISLTGDKSDNIPGIPYIGYKTASQLLKIYNNIENLFLNINKLNNNIKNKIKNFKNLVFLSKRIIKISSNININNLYPRYKIRNIQINILLIKINYIFFYNKIKKIKKILYL